jgi:hypothetical protein
MNRRDNKKIDNSENTETAKAKTINWVGNQIFARGKQFCFNKTVFISHPIFDSGVCVKLSGLCWEQSKAAKAETSITSLHRSKFEVIATKST